MNIDKLIKVIQEANPEKEWELQHIHGVIGSANPPLQMY